MTMMNMAMLARMAQTPEGRRLIATNAAQRGITAQQVAQAAQPGLGGTIAGPPALGAQQAMVSPQASLTQPPIPRPRPEDLGVPSTPGFDPQKLVQALGAVRPPPVPNRPVMPPILPRRGDVNVSQAGVADLAALMNLPQQQVPSLGALIGGI